MESEKIIGYLLAKTLRIFKVRMVTSFREEGIELTFEQFVIMQILSAESDIIQQDLADHLQKDKSIIVRQVNCLLNKKLVERHAGVNDKRKRYLVLSAQGKLLLEQLRQIRTSVTDDLLSGVSEAEYDTFRKVLAKIQKNGDRRCETIFK